MVYWTLEHVLEKAVTDLNLSNLLLKYDKLNSETIATNVDGLISNVFALVYV